jgi:long-chain acyl-CoA synthetase
MSEDPQTFNQAILAAMDDYTALTCFKVRHVQGSYHDISYERFRTLTLRLAHFFQQQGIRQGERVAIIADNCLEWMISYIACLLAGGIAVPLRFSLSGEMLQLMLQACDASLVIVADEAQAHILAQTDRELPNLKTIMTLAEISGSNSAITPLTAIVNKPLAAEAQQAIRVYAKNIPAQALATLRYSTDEAGQPRMAVFNQGQCLQSMNHLARWLIFEEDDLLFTFLPWNSAHSLDISLHAFLAGVANVISGLTNSIEAVLDSLRQTSPTLMLITPLSLENFYYQIMDEFDQMPEASQEVFQWALAIGKAYQAAGADVSETLREEYNRADMTFFNRIRGKIGGRVRRLYYVDAPLPQKLADFIEVIGPQALNIYGVAEAGGFPAVSYPSARRPGSCGRVAPGFQIRLGADGEILVKSPTVMARYWEQPSETQQAIDSEGWLHTGDLGRFDQEGYLYLTGRKKSLIALSSGRKVRPTPIENALKESPYVAQAIVFGEGRSCLSALIIPDLEALAAHFQEDSEANAPDAPPSDQDILRWFWHSEGETGEPIVTLAHPGVKRQMDKVVQMVNNRLDRWEQITHYSLLEHVLSKLAHELADLTPGKRRQFEQRYAAQIDLMYPQVSSPTEREITQFQVTPERMRELLEKENILDAWLADAGIGFLFDLARRKQIDAPSMVHICDIAAHIAQMESESRPLSTALIVGNPAQITRVLSPSQVQLLHYEHIRRMRKILMSLTPLVDGMVLGYVVDKYGYVRGIHKLELPPDEQPANRLLGPQFRRHAAISEQCNAIVFFVPKGGRQVRVFANGQLVGRYSNGDWAPESILRVDEIVSRLAQQKDYDISLVRRILRCAFRMSEENQGAIFIIGNADKVLASSDQPEIGHFALIVSTHLDTLSDEELINFAKQDGATVIDVQGKFRGCMVLLRPDAGTKAEIGPGKGARHSSAAKMSAEAQCLAITVSQDGPITVYSNGERILSL